MLAKKEGQFLANAKHFKRKWRWKFFIYFFVKQNTIFQPLEMRDNETRSCGEREKVACRDIPTPLHSQRSFWGSIYWRRKYKKNMGVDVVFGVYTQVHGGEMNLPPIWNIHVCHIRSWTALFSLLTCTYQPAANLISERHTKVLKHLATAAPAANIVVVA